MQNNQTELFMIIDNHIYAYLTIGFHYIRNLAVLFIIFIFPIFEKTVQVWIRKKGYNCVKTLFINNKLEIQKAIMRHIW